MVGTLMWVGDTTATEFRGAVEYCLVNISQLAFRRNMAEAESRPASDVRWVLFAQSDRNNFDRRRLLHRYPKAKAITLRGSLCQGIEQSYHTDCCDWHCWEQELPTWFGLGSLETLRCQTVAVVASSLSAADPLLDLAQSCGATAIWCRNENAQQVRNIDAVWWDDSVATPVSVQGWTSRMNSFARAGKSVQHAWIANAPTMWDAQQAREAGIGWLVSKPHRIDSLTQMLTQCRLERPRLQAA